MAMVVARTIYHVNDMPDREHASLCSQASAWTPCRTWPTDLRFVGERTARGNEQARGDKCKLGGEEDR